MLLLNQTTNQYLKLVTQDTDPKYSLSDDSYSDTSDNKSSFDEVNISVLNEPQNIDLTTENENRRQQKKKNSHAIRKERK